MLFLRRKGFKCPVIEGRAYMSRKQKGIVVDEDSWYALKSFCAMHKLSIVDQAGKIIEEWVAQNCADHRV